MSTQSSETSAAAAAEIGSTLQQENASKFLKFEDSYTLTQRLRSGSYGIVFVTRHLGIEADYAVKVIDRKKLKKKDDDSVFREVDILRQLMDCAGVIRLIDFYESPEKFYVVQEWAQGGDVFDKLAKRTTYTEKDARELSLVLLETMHTMHTRGLVHRDLKPENLLLKNTSDDSNIKVADFGFARKVPEEGLRTRCGTVRTRARFDRIFFLLLTV